jgi:hypothetical protein
MGLRNSYHMTRRLEKMMLAKSVSLSESHSVGELTFIIM